MWLNRLRITPKSMWVTPKITDIFILKEFKKLSLFVAKFQICKRIKIFFFYKEQKKNHRGMEKKIKVQYGEKKQPALTGSMPMGYGPLKTPWTAGSSCSTLLPSRVWNLQWENNNLLSHERHNHSVVRFTQWQKLRLN